MDGPVHIAVVGGSGSGKTWLAERLAAALAPRTAHLSLDDFYRDLSSLPAAERDRVNFDDPAAIDWEKFREIVEGLATGAVELPLYDFATHTRKTETRRLEPVPLVIWDGLWLLHPDWLRGKFAFSIYVDCGPEERFRRRAERDVRSRGRSFESVQCQFFEQVEPMNRQFVEPQRARATVAVASPLAGAEIAGLVRKLLEKGKMPHTGRPSND